MNQRHLARRLALVSLYEADLQGLKTPQETDRLLALAHLSGLVDQGIDLDYPQAGLAYVQAILAYVIGHQETLDHHLQAKMAKRPLARLSPTDRSILRLGLGEIYREEDPAKKPLYIDEAVELAKAYSEGKSYQFINGLLDALLKEESHDPDQP